MNINDNWLQKNIQKYNVKVALNMKKLYKKKLEDVSFANLTLIKIIWKIINRHYIGLCFCSKSQAVKTGTQ